MNVIEKKQGNKKVEFASFVYTKQTKGLNWNVEKETSTTTLSEANAESKLTKKGDQYLRLTIDGVVYAQFEANFMNAYVKATEAQIDEGSELEIPMDAEFKLTPNGVEFAAN